MPEARKARAVGVNHVALEVADIDEALAFYGCLFDFELRGRSEDAAFIDLGDQFLALQKGRTQPADDGRHFGLVVDDKEAVRAALDAAGVEDFARALSRLPRSMGQPHRDRRLRQHPIHQGCACLARHGTGAFVEERAGDQGTVGQGHGADLTGHARRRATSLDAMLAPVLGAPLA